MAVVKFRICGPSATNPVDVIPPGRGLDAVDAGPDAVIFRVGDPERCPETGVVRLFVVEPGYHPLECAELQDCIGIVRRVEAWDGITGAPTRVEDYPRVLVGMPAHCDWRECVVIGAVEYPTRLDSELFSTFARIDIGADEVIDADASTAGDCAGYRGRKSIPVLDNGVLVPGMAVTATHIFKNGSRVYSSQCGRRYYRTCSLTGGVVTAVIGDYDTPEIRYRVLVEGAEITCPPSDFVRWEVGDYVFLTGGPGSCKLACDLGAAAIPETAPPEGSGVAGEFLKILNNYRVSLGLSRLTWNEKLTDAAEAHAADMIQHGFFSHDGSDGSTPAIRIGRTGYAAPGLYGYGENIAYGSARLLDEAAEAFAGWRASPTHDANMRNPDFREAGLACAKAPNGDIYWVNTFGWIDASAGGADAGNDPAGTGGWVILPLRVGSKGA